MNLSAGWNSLFDIRVEDVSPNPFCVIERPHTRPAAALLIPRTLATSPSGNYLDYTDQAAVYLLMTGPEIDGPGRVYVGEAERVVERLRNQTKMAGRSWWTRAVAFSSPSLNKAHVRQLEHLLLEELKSRAYDWYEVSNSGARRSSSLDPRDAMLVSQVFAEAVTLLPFAAPWLFDGIGRADRAPRSREAPAVTAPIESQAPDAPIVTSNTTTRQGPNYRSTAFTEETWRQFLEAGGAILGAPKKAQSWASSLRAGDRVVCYVTAPYHRVVGLSEVLEDGVGNDGGDIWGAGAYPVRVRSRLLAFVVDPIDGIDVHDQTAMPLPFMQNARGWMARFQGSFRVRWPSSEGEIVSKAIQDSPQFQRQTDLNQE